jgi:hypothetical protein
LTQSHASKTSEVDYAVTDREVRITMYDVLRICYAAHDVSARSVLQQNASCVLPFRHHTDHCQLNRSSIKLIQRHAHKPQRRSRSAVAPVQLMLAPILLSHLESTPSFHSIHFAEFPSPSYTWSLHGQSSDTTSDSIAIVCSPPSSWPRTSSISKPGSTTRS